MKNKDPLKWVFLVDGSSLLSAWQKIAFIHQLNFKELKLAIQDYYGLENNPESFLYFDPGENQKFGFDCKSIDIHLSEVQGCGAKIIEDKRYLKTFDNNDVSVGSSIIGAMSTLGNDLSNYKIVVLTHDAWLIKPFIQYLKAGANIYLAIFHSAYPNWGKDWFTLLLDSGFYMFNLDRVKEQVFKKKNNIIEVITELQTPRSQINGFFADEVIRKPVNRQALREIVPASI